MKRTKSDINKLVDKSVEYIRSQVSIRPKVAIVLGSGLGDFAESLIGKTIIETSSIPHYPRSTVEGHKGKLIFGKLNHLSVLAFQGRVHFYESGDLETILYPIRVAHAFNIKTLIVTNAAGGFNPNFKPGDLMMITDQINLTFENPLVGLKQSAISHNLYDKSIQQLIIVAAHEQNIPVKEGIYCGIKGPSYETAAEVEMIRRIGADAVGMSTVNEVSLARAFGMRVGGISCITNLSTGILDQKLSHREVTEIANMVKDPFSKLLQGIIHNIGKET